MKSPLHQLSIISRFGEVEMCPQEKAGLVWGRVGVGGWGGQLRLSPVFRCVCGGDCCTGPSCSPGLVGFS